MAHNNVYRALHGHIKRETDKALLFQPMKASGELVGVALWFPISQCKSIHRTYDEIEGTFDIIMASEWILGQKGLLSIAGVAGVNPVTSAQVANKTTTIKQNCPAPKHWQDLDDDVPDDYFTRHIPD